MFTPRVTCPAAEKFARCMPLPVVIDRVTRELYGYSVPILDEKAARNALTAAGFLNGDPAQDAAMSILMARAERLAER